MLLFWSFLFLFFFIFTLFLSSCILILLIFTYKIVHIGFGFCEFHFVHSFTSVPMEESFSSEHCCKLLADSLEHLLNGSWVSNECDRHLKSFWWDIADWWFNVIRNPLDKVWRVFVLDIEHLFINFFRGHSSSEHGWGGKISSVSWIGGAHHVFGIKHLLG